MTNSQRQSLEKTLDSLLSLIGVYSIFSLVSLFGFELTPGQSQFLDRSVYSILWVFIAQELIRLIVAPLAKDHFKNRWLETCVALLNGLYLLLPQRVLTQFTLAFGDIRLNHLTLIYLGLTQSIVLAALMVRGLRESSWVSQLKLNPGRIFILSFFVAVSIGSLLLMLPKASNGNLSWIDAVFTAVSAVCVTGLTTIDTYSELTPLGHLILLGLIQLGGLGIMTFAMAFSALLMGSLEVRDKVLLAEVISEERVGEVMGILGQITLFTFTLEGLGAFYLYFTGGGGLWPIDGSLFFESVFHSVSAFCNAGFTLYSGGLAGHPVLSENKIFLSGILFLALMGGLGVPVLVNIRDVFLGKRKWVPNLGVSLSTKLVLYSSGILLLFGTLFIWMVERQGSFTGLSTEDQLFQSFFLSVTSRTSGFSIWPTDQLSLGASYVLMLLMWVGGSPMSTAGGVKTLTVTVAFLNAKAVVRGQQPRLFGRVISKKSVKRSFAALTLSLVGLLVSASILSILEPHIKMRDLIFEVVSAWSSVGLTQGITPMLSPGSKFVLIVSMLLGRVGLLTFLSGLLAPKPDTKHRLLDEGIVIS